MSAGVLLVTGAGSGLGQMIAKKALAEDWSVAALDVSAEGLDAIGQSGKLLKITVDVTDESAVSAAVDQCEAELGPITRVVNAAAIMPLGLLAEQPGSLVKKIMDINYGGLINVSSAIMPKFLARGAGEFVSFASMAGHWPLIYMGAYAASKHAVASYTEVLHHETRKSGVRVVCVCPPIVATPLLKQAEDTVWPKVFDQFAPIEPELVLKEIDKVLRTKALWVFPGPLTRLSWLMRRWMPGPLWAFVHKKEGVG